MNEELKPPNVPVLRARVLAGLPRILCQQKAGEFLCFSLMRSDETFEKKTQTHKEMADEFNKVLASDPSLGLEHLQKIFGNSVAWNQFVNKTMKPRMWALVRDCNRYAMAYANCVMILEYFKNVHDMTSEKPTIELKDGLPTLTLGTDLIAILRFNLKYDANSGQIKCALSLEKDKVSLPFLFSGTFSSGETKHAEATLNRYLAMRLPAAGLLPQHGLVLTTEQRVKFAKEFGVSQNIIERRVEKGM
jgi:hypothetical protein